MIRDEIEALIKTLPEGLHADPDARRFLWHVLGPVAIVRDYLLGRAGDLPDLLDPNAVPDGQVRYLAHMVGLAADLPATFALDAAELRRLIPVAVELWRRKGSRQSIEDVLIYVGHAPFIILEWRHVVTIDGVAGARVMHPRYATEVGSAYDHPEGVLDVWIADPAGAVALDRVDNWLAVMCAANRSINRYRAVFVDTLLAPDDLWDVANPGANGDGYQGTGSDLAMVVSAGNVAVTKEAGADVVDGTGKSVWALITVDTAGGLALYADGVALDNAYTVLIDTGADEISLYERIAGVPTIRATAVGTTIGTPFVDGVEYDLRVHTGEVAAGLEVVVLVNAIEAIRYVITAPRAGGYDGLVADASGSVSSRLTIVYLRGEIPRTITGE